MACFRKPGPLGVTHEVQDLNDGTLIRVLSARPGPIGKRRGPSSAAQRRLPAAFTTLRVTRKKTASAELQALSRGSRGPEVEKLQRMLNARSKPSPQLVVDGTFGPLTLQAVLDYQKGVSNSSDGIVGKQTWFHLLKGDSVTVARTSVPVMPPSVGAAVAGTKKATSVQPPKTPSRLAQPSGIWEWSLQDKFAEALRRTAPKLPGSMRGEFAALLSPASLRLMAGTFVVWAGSHAFGAGEVVDVMLLIAGAYFLGTAVVDVARELGEFLIVTSGAADESDLDEAASHLARVIAIMGVAAFIALLAKVAKGRGSKRGAAEAPAKPQVTRRESARVSTSSLPEKTIQPHVASAGTKAADSNATFVSLMKQVESLDVGSPKNGAVVYSGKGNRRLAEKFATEHGKTTLEMTPGGKWLDQQKLFGPDSRLTPDQATKVWSRLSERYAEASSGNVVGFVTGARAQGIFNAVEYPALLKNPNVVNVITGGH